MAKIIKFPKKNVNSEMNIEVTLVDMQRIKKSFGQILTFCHGLDAIDTANPEELTYALLEATLEFANLAKMSPDETMDMLKSVEIEEIPSTTH